MENVKNKKFIKEFRVDNYGVFSKPVQISFEGDMRTKRLSSNVHSLNSYNILKTIALYGPNNSGKTNLIKALSSVKSIFLNRKTNIVPCLFNKNRIVSFGISFLYEEHLFDINIKYDTSKSEYIYESLGEIVKDKYGNMKTNNLILKDSIEKEYYCKDSKMTEMLSLTSKDNILIYLIDSSKSEFLDKTKNMLIDFASAIEVVNMNNIPIERTFQIIKNNDERKEEILNIIKNADLSIDDIRYDENLFSSNFSIETDGKDDEKVLKHLKEQCCLVSTHKKVDMPFIIFDSTGTKKIFALSSYIVDAFKEGKILVVDELDSSLHYKITRAIIALFNNDLNDNSQLIFSVHDINMIDCKKLMRKDQIWFLYRNEEQTYLYPLSSFTAVKDGIRDTTDIIDKLNKGILGAVPKPDFIRSIKFYN